MSICELSLLDPVQPYLLQTTARYYKYPVYQRGIQEFFSFCTYGKEQADSEGLLAFRMVPDLGIQMLFSCQERKLSQMLLKPDTEGRVIQLKPDTEYFGIRFIPGIQKAAETFAVDAASIEKIRICFSQESAFSQRCRIFQRIFEDYLLSSKEHNGCSQVPFIYALITKSNGDIRIEEMSRYLGYSQRYMGKMVKNGFGMSPKTLCKYMKFQKALEYLGRRNDMDITEVSTRLGYYDQSHFVKCFKEFTGTTPKNYVRMIRQNKLYQKIEKIGPKEAPHADRKHFTSKEWKMLFLAE